MKILGYIDDGITWFVSWQYHIGWWNLLIIPMEFGILDIIYGMFRTVEM